MRLSPGERLGPYEVTALIGAGGMGEVYRGIDTRLGRSVAIKMASHEFSERFEREARAISALNHPHICTLYDLGPDYLIMELVEGETLSRLIARGPIPLDKALVFATHIVDALAAAHAKGIVHRDLKPDNIIVTANGIKVLDFGLAKLLIDQPPVALAATTAPTGPGPITGAGAIVGTLHYMAPEQVEAKDADARADIFAFGTVVYEMVTGQRPFPGDTPASVLAAILKDQPPPMAERQPRTPKALERIVKRCLEKRPDDRWQSARDLKPALELVDLEPTTSALGSGLQLTSPSQASRRPLRWVMAALVVVAAAVALYQLWPRSVAPARLTRFEVPLPEGVEIDSGSFYVRVAPDGSKLAFTTVGQKSGIWVRDLSSVEVRLLPGTQNAIAPFWSADSNSLAFGIDNKLMRVDLSGGSPRVLAESEWNVGSGFWSMDGQIVFGHRGRGSLVRVATSGGVPVKVTQLAPGDGFHGLPSLLPDGRHLLYLRAGTEYRVFGASLDLTPERQPLDPIMPAEFGVGFTPGDNSGRGYLFFVREDTLMAQPFNPAAMRPEGEPMPIVQQIGKGPAHAYFSVVPSVMAYRNGPGSNTQLTWVDRRGNTLERTGDPGNLVAFAVSPDEQRIAIVRTNQRRPIAVGNTARWSGDIWILDVARNVEARFTTGQATTVLGPLGPVWSPDGRQLAFASETRLFVKDAGGASDARLIKDFGHNVGISDWTRDGQFLIMTEEGAGGADIRAVAVADGDSTPVVATDSFEAGGRISPDGAWIAYVAAQSGRFDAYVRPFARTGAAAAASGPVIQISRDGGSEPSWSGDGHELLFVGNDGRLMSAAIERGGGTFRPAAAVPLGVRLFDGSSSGVLAIGKNGDRILIDAPLDRGDRTPITVVTNWEALLRPLSR